MVLLVALGGGSDSVESTVYLTMAALMLFVNLLEKSYALSLHDEVTHLPARRAMRCEIKSVESSYALALVSVDHYKMLQDRYGRDASDRIRRKIAGDLRRVDRHSQPFRYSGKSFVLVFAGKGRNEVIGDLEALRADIADIEDFRFPKSPNGMESRKSESPKDPSVRWFLTVTVGVAERREEGWWWSSQIRRYRSGRLRGPVPRQKGGREHSFEVKPRLVVPSTALLVSRFPGHLLLPFCRGVSLASYVGPQGVSHGAQYVQLPNLGKGRW